MTETLVDPFRPLGWNDYVGQDRLKNRLRLAIDAALEGGRPLDHILLAATPGAGKSSIANLIAHEMCSMITEVNAPLDKGFLRWFMEKSTGILFIDEIHRLTTAQQEDLLPVLEHRRLDVGRGHTISNPEVTIIGATTEPKKVLKPLRQRFRIVPKYDPYSVDELARIVSHMANKVDMGLDVETCEVLGRASGGIPRQAGTLVLAARDLWEARNELDPYLVLEMEQIHPSGLTRDHRDYLDVLVKMGGRCGLTTLANRLQMDEALVLDVEQMLLDRDLVEYTDRGREITPEGRRALP